MTDRNLPNTESRRLASTLAGRLAAVRLQLEGPSGATLKEVADALGVNERTIKRHFGTVSALLAFPPPELGRGIAEWAASAPSWPVLLQRIQPMFADLDSNVEGRELLAGLAEIHRRSPEMTAADGFFAGALADAIGVDLVRDPKVMAWIGYLTNALRSALLLWSNDASRSVLSVHQALGALMLSVFRPEQQ